MRPFAIHCRPASVIDMQFFGFRWVQIPPSTNASHHIAVVALPRENNLPFKIPQLRNLFDKTGMDLAQRPIASRVLVFPMTEGSIPWCALSRIPFS